MCVVCTMLRFHFWFCVAFVDFGVGRCVGVVVYAVAIVGVVVYWCVCARTTVGVTFVYDIALLMVLIVMCDIMLLLLGVRVMWLFVFCSCDLCYRGRDHIPCCGRLLCCGVYWWH